MNEEKEAFTTLLKNYKLDYEEFNNLLKIHKAFVCGSFALSVKLHVLDAKLGGIETFSPQDIDIFVGELEQDSELETYLIRKGYECRIGVTHITTETYMNRSDEYFFRVREYKLRTAETGVRRIQIINFANKDINFFKNIDLTCTKFFWNPEKEMIDYDGEPPPMMTTEIDLEFANQKLLERCHKYIKRGFTIYYKKKILNDVIDYIMFENNGGSSHTLGYTQLYRKFIGYLKNI